MKKKKWHDAICDAANDLGRYKTLNVEEETRRKNNINTKVNAIVGRTCERHSRDLHYLYPLSLAVVQSQRTYVERKMMLCPIGPVQGHLESTRHAIK